MRLGAFGLQLGDRRAKRERFALGDKPVHYARGLGLVGHRRLVGLDLDEVLPGCDELPVRPEPANDRPFLHRVGQPRHDDDRLRRHERNSVYVPLGSG